MSSTPATSPRRPAAPALPALLALALAVALPGCGGSGDTLPRLAVSGTVTYAGQPLKAGSISFTPANPGEKDTVSGGGAISDGKYSIPQEVGLVPGKYNVSISSASAEVEAGDAPGAVKALPKEFLPAKYNSKSTLTAEVKPGGGPIDFPLEK